MAFMVVMRTLHGRLKNEKSLTSWCFLDRWTRFFQITSLGGLFAHANYDIRSKYSENAYGIHNPYFRNL